MHPTDKEQGFLKLIQENKGIILKICHLYCPLPADREDLTQEIVYQLWRSADRCDEQRRWSTWMYRVALNTAISFYREGRKRGALPLSPLHVAIEDVHDPYASDQRMGWLQNCIQDLKEFDRALILLYFEEKSYKEMAEIMGISETNVATRLSRIKDRLRQCVQSSANESASGRTLSPDRSGISLTNKK
jgi:RNA polymerase sigma-70 factor (ECF subfamily)